MRIGATTFLAYASGYEEAKNATSEVTLRVMKRPKAEHQKRSRACRRASGKQCLYRTESVRCPLHIVNVGNVELISLNDNLPVRSPFVAFPHTTMEQWNEYPDLKADHENVNHRWGSLAIRSSGKLIIVDTGMQGEGCYLLDDMKEKGIDRDAVDIVGFTPEYSLGAGRPDMETDLFGTEFETARFILKTE